MTTVNPSPRRQGRRFVAAMLAGSLLFAACGSDDSDGTATTDTAAEVTDTVAPADDAMADDDAMAETTGAFGPGCAAVPADGAGSFAGMAADPAATAAGNNPELSTLVTAVGIAGLGDTLNGDGPFTIFAPTNDAFAAIDPATLEMVLADTELLTTILTYHVIAGESLDADALAAAGSADTFEGGTLTFGSDGTTVNNATAVCSNVATANATVHIIDQVLLPPQVVEALAAG